MPVHNEAAVLDDVLGELEREVVAKFEGDVEVVVMDDRSTDGSAELLDRAAAANGWLRVVHAAVNRGHGPSVRAGLDEAAGDWVFVLDSDGDIPASAFWELWPHAGAADLVLGVRSGRSAPRHRLVLTRAVRIFTSTLAGTKIADANVPFRLVRRDLWHGLRPLIGNDVLAPAIMVSLGTAVLGRRIVQVPIPQRPGRARPSSLRRGRLLRFSARGLGQVVAYRIRLARARQ